MENVFIGAVILCIFIGICIKVFFLHPGNDVEGPVSGGERDAQQEALRLAQEGINRAMEPYRKQAQEDFERAKQVAKEEAKPITKRTVLVNTTPATEAEKKWLREG